MNRRVASAVEASRNRAVILRRAIMRLRVSRAMKHRGILAVAEVSQGLVVIPRRRANRALRPRVAGAVGAVGAVDLAVAAVVDSAEEDGRVVATTVAGTTAGVATTAVSDL